MRRRKEPRAFPPSSDMHAEKVAEEIAKVEESKSAADKIASDLGELRRQIELIMLAGRESS